MVLFSLLGLRTFAKSDVETYGGALLVLGTMSMYIAENAQCREIGNIVPDKPL